MSQKFTIWMPDEDAEKVREITTKERRGSHSKTIAALTGEAIEARERRDDGQKRPKGAA